MTASIGRPETFACGYLTLPSKTNSNNVTDTNIIFFSSQGGLQPPCLGACLGSQSLGPCLTSFEVRPLETSLHAAGVSATGGG